MKYAFLTLCLGTFLLSCSTSPGPAKDKELTICYEETVNLSGGSLTFADVQDSRCPTDVQCVRASEAIVKLTVKPGTGSENNTLTMCLGDCGAIYPKKGFVMADSVTTQIGGVSHLVVLTKVLPVPSTKNPTEKKDYVVTLLDRVN